MKVTVETEDLFRALRSVTPHASPDKDFVQLHRVRLIPGGQTATVSATNRYTVGHALVSVWEWDGELGSIDLSPRDVKELLTVFRGKVGKDEPDATLELEATDEHLTITDISGLFPGKSLTLPRYATDENFPRVEEVIQATLVGGRKSTERLVTSGELLGLFMKAAAAYGQPLVFDPTGKHGAMLITCGESFIGLLMPQRQDDDQARALNAWHDAWLERINARAVLV